MAESSPLDVSTWIRKLGPDFKDSVTPYGLSCIFPYHQIRVDERLLLRNLLLLWVNRRLMILSFLPWEGIFLPCCEWCWVSLKPQPIGGVFLANLTLGWSLITFSVQTSLRVKGHDHTTFVLPFAYVPFKDIFWFNSHIVWTFGCVWWLMS